ncbi:MAG TPA: thiolase domain-containing protein [Trebonia sp.]|jgi:acetyl-CoA C-acetyltransferase|nr:thiolase domain-containing protein [Trebonia sp.]
MSIRGKAHIAGAFEHPDRKIPGKSIPQVHAEVALGALADAGLAMHDVDAYFCAADAPGFGPLSMADYLGLTRLRYVDSTETGGSSYLVHVGHAAAAIAAGKCSVALITLAGLPRSVRLARPSASAAAPEAAFEQPFGPTTVSMYALAARRHMHEYGTTSAQLAAIKVVASQHAQHNPNAMLRTPVTVEEVLDSPMISDPLHRLDCCVISDGGGALVVTSPEVAASLPRQTVTVLGHGESPKLTANGRLDLTHTGAVWSGPRAFAEAGVTPADIDYASIYDSFTITVLQAVEDLGFCPKGKGGAFVADGALLAPHGALPFNTDGGGLCNNHPANRGGMTKVIEAVRQLRGEANAPVQVPDCEIALAHGNGGSLGTRSGAATLILGREDA